MRLGQLARQLDISPDKIVTFLGSRDIAIDSSANARVDDQYVDLIVQHFAPGNETLRQQIHQEPEVSSNPEPVESVNPTEESLPEVIKAPKIELPGLRVVGKIELPEKKKKEAEKPSEEPAAPQESRPKPLSRNPRRESPPRNRHNPVALAREREEQEKRRREAEAREREKQRKAEYYQKRLKPQPPTKAVRLHREEMAEMPKVEREKPKTLWGRFMRWLND
jgi:hypothetical protein